MVMDFGGQTDIPDRRPVAQKCEDWRSKLLKMALKSRQKGSWVIIRCVRKSCQIGFSLELWPVEKRRFGLRLIDPKDKSRLRDAISTTLNISEKSFRTFVIIKVNISTAVLNSVLVGFGSIIEKINTDNF